MHGYLPYKYTNASLSYCIVIFKVLNKQYLIANLFSQPMRHTKLQLNFTANL